MANPKLVGGKFKNCPDGWGCRIVNDNLIRAFNLEDSGIEVLNHGFGEKIAVDGSCLRKRRTLVRLLMGPAAAAWHV